MQLTRAADYGIRAMVHLAGSSDGRRVSSAELAEAAEVPDTFMAKVLQKLVISGLVQSSRGQGGGFRLGAPAAEISLLDVVEAIEGPITLNRCTNPLQRCSRQDWCAVHVVWNEVQEQMREMLAAARLDRLAQDSAAARGCAIRGGAGWTSS